MAHKAFVSSTFLDLKDHRDHVIRALRSAGIHVDPMEDWPADHAEPKEFSRDRLEGCDLCILLVAFRRGFVPPGETKSITQLEYEEAIRRGIRVYPLLLDEKSPWRHEFYELDRDPEVRRWREHLVTRHGHQLFELEPGSIDITGLLGRFLSERTMESAGAPPPGWLERHLADLREEIGTITVPLAGSRRPRVLPLERIFVPLPLRIQGSSGDVEAPTWISLLRRERVALTGDAGSGKSTLLRYVALQAARRLARPTPDAVAPPPSPGAETAIGPARIPVFLDLASTGTELVGRPEANGGAAEIPPNRWLSFLGARLRLQEPQVASVLGEGNVLLLLDGLDELPDPYDREMLVDSIGRMQRHFSPLHAQNHVIVACREPAWGVGEAFTRFEKAIIQPMDRATIREYLGRWTEEVWGPAGQAILATLERALNAAALGELASNPQMSTLLALVRYTEETPRQQALLFEYFVRRLGRGGRRMPVGEQHALRSHLVALAVEMQRTTSGDGEPLNSIRLQKAELLLGRRATAAAPAPTPAEVREQGAALLSRLEIAFGLLHVDREEGLAHRGLVRFKHRTFQEYLAACHYAEHGFDELVEHAVDPGWAKVLALTCGVLTQIDESAVRTLLERILQTPASANGDLPPQVLIEWAPRVAAASVCLQELATYELEPETLAPAHRAHDLILPLFAERTCEVDVSTRVRIAEGLGSILDPRLLRASRWVTIPAGPFVRGSEVDEAWVQERPRTVATLGEFTLMRWPVTVAEYRRFLEEADGYAANEYWEEEGRAWREANRVTAPSGWQQMRLRGNRPVTGVSWWEARAFCRWWATVDPSLPAGWQVDLPTEAQWEKAARGGREAAIGAGGATPLGAGEAVDGGAARGGQAGEQRFPWGDEWGEDRANCAATGVLSVVPVGLFPGGHSRPFQLWDLAGNVAERCRDGFGPYASTERTDPVALDYRYGHVVRGGSFQSLPLDLRLTCRFGAPREGREDAIGFRCVAFAPAGASVGGARS